MGTLTVMRVGLVFVLPLRQQCSSPWSRGSPRSAPTTSTTSGAGSNRSPTSSMHSTTSSANSRRPMPAALDRIDQLAIEIQDAQVRVDAQSAELSTLQGQLADIAVDKFMSGGSSGLTPLFSSAEGFTDDLERGQKSWPGSLSTRAPVRATRCRCSSSSSPRTRPRSTRRRTSRRSWSPPSRSSSSRARRSRSSCSRSTPRPRPNSVRPSSRSRSAVPPRQQLPHRPGSRQPQRSSRRPRAAPPTRRRWHCHAHHGRHGRRYDRSVRWLERRPGRGAHPGPVGPGAGVHRRYRHHRGAGPARRAVQVRCVVARRRVDCSGLASTTSGQAGVYLPHQSRAQYASIPHVDKGAAAARRPALLLQPDQPRGRVPRRRPARPRCRNTGSVVKIASVNWGKVSGVSRPG